MLDNALIKLVISTIIAQEAIAGIPNTPVKQAFQPTQQGVNTVPTAYLYKISDNRLGSRAITDKWNVDEQELVHTELQQYETMFQISALATQEPTNATQYTASDIINLIAYILQSESTIAAFNAKGVGILKIGTVRNPYFLNDKHRHEANPSFDFTLTHKQIVSSINGVIQSTEFQVITV